MTNHHWKKLQKLLKTEIKIVLTLIQTHGGSNAWIRIPLLLCKHSLQQGIEPTSSVPTGALRTLLSKDTEV